MSGRKNRDVLQGPVSFFLMSLEFWLRDLRHPPVKILREAGAGPGQTILDYGCGPGSFSIAAAQLVGPNGKVYAVDINPIALRAVSRKALKRGFNNITPVLAHDTCNLPVAEVGVAILYDVLHDLPDPPEVLALLHRTMKAEGILTVSDHHMTEPDIISTVVSGRLFRLTRRCTGHGKILCFERSPNE